MATTYRGINGTKEMDSERVRIKVTFTHLFKSVIPAMYLGNKSYDCNDLKRKYSHLDVLPCSNINLKNVKVVQGQDNYHLLFPVAYRKVKRNEPCDVKTKLGWTLSGPLPKHEVAHVQQQAMLHPKIASWGRNWNPGSTWSHTPPE